MRSFIQLGETINLSMGINISSRQDESWNISYIVLRQKKGNISILTSGLFDGRSELLPVAIGNLITRGIRVHMNFESGSVLTKALPESSAEDHVNNTFPGIDAGKFVFQRTDAIQERYYSLVRKDLIENSSLFQKCRENVVSVSFGPFIVSSLVPFLENDVLDFPGYQVETKEGKIAKVRKENETTGTRSFLVGGEPVSSELILAYASALNIFLDAGHVHVHGIESVVECRQRVYAKRSIFTVARISALILFVILFTNALGFLWLKEKTQGMEISMRTLSARNSHSIQRQGSLTEAGKAYDAIGWNSSLAPVYIADQLAASVPADVLLEVLEIGVLNQDVLRRDKFHSFDSHHISVKGVVSDPSMLNEWLTRVQAFGWVAQIRNQKYHFEDRLRKGVFELTIVLR